VTIDMLERLQLLAKVLLDARTAAAAVAKQAETDGLYVGDYDLRQAIGALRGRVDILIELDQDGPKQSGL
jgi:hypothetical protein